METKQDWIRSKHSAHECCFSYLFVNLANRILVKCHSAHLNGYCLMSRVPNCSLVYTMTESTS